MKNKINIPFLCLFFYIMFPILFKGISSYQQMVIYTISILGIIFNIKKIFAFMLKGKILYAVIAYIIVLISSLIFPYVYKTYDYTYFQKLMDIFYYSLKYFFLVCIFINIHKKEASVELFFKYFIYSCCILIFSTCFFLMFPNVKSVWTTIIYNSEKNYELINLSKYITRYSIIGFTGFRQTFICVISFIFSMYIILKKNKKDKKNMVICLFTAIVSLIGTIFYGRIGTIIILLICLLLLPQFMKNKKNLRIFIICLIILIIAVSILNTLKDKNKMINTWYNWAFAIFINFFDNGELGDASTNALTNMYFMPELSTLLIGDAKYTTVTGGYYMSTDVGFLRSILFYGVFFTIISYMIFVFILLGINDKFKHLNYKFETKILFLILISIILFELKGEIYQYIIPILIDIYIIISWQTNNNEMEKGKNERKQIDKYNNNCI